MIIHRVKAELECHRHRATLAGVLRMPPVAERDSAIIVLSQVCARDFLMYILAAKSFARHSEACRFAVLDDGSLTPEHHELLRTHLPGVAICDIDAARSEATPKGGCWERLLKLVEIGQQSYVVQLDADTITLGPLGEVAQCIRSGTGFTLSSETDARIVPLRIAA
ncbi:MAG: hypothetical protein JOZ58_04420, partial [Acetobacteraceae bacterium]|nr:hypothetical protein [Acetobacteraceae bacterium]